MNSPRRTREHRPAGQLPPAPPELTPREDEMAASVAAWFTPFGAPAGYVGGGSCGDGHHYSSISLNNYARAVYRDGEFWACVELAVSMNGGGK